MARTDKYVQYSWPDLAMQAGYSAKLLSENLGMSRRQLERVIGGRFGLSPQKWLDAQRINRAVDLLRKQKSIKMVAFELGFKWVSHFCAQFKRHYHLSPTAFLNSSIPYVLPGSVNGKTSRLIEMQRTK